MEKLEFVSTKKEKVFSVIREIKPTINFSILKTALRKKDIKVNNKKIADNIEVEIGDLITVYFSEKKEKEVEIIFEDENILIANKPRGMEVTKQDKAYLLSKCMEEIVGADACNRLDKNTEGIVVFAKNEIAKNVMFDVFKEHKIEKKYLAIVSGNIQKNGEILENYIKKEGNFAKICKKTDKNAKFSKMQYSVVCQKEDLFLIDIDLFTGRFHQIRAQLKNKNIFILGDEKYGDKDKNKKYHIKKQQLNCYYIKFLDLPKPLNYLRNKEFFANTKFDLSLFDEK